MSDKTETTHPQMPGRTQGLRSRLASGTKLNGELSVPGIIEILGEIDGAIAAGMIIVEVTGSVVGEMNAANISIKGHVDGAITGTDVRLHASAVVSGEIYYSTLMIESGARVDAACSPKATT